MMHFFKSSVRNQCMIGQMHNAQIRVQNVHICTLCTWIVHYAFALICTDFVLNFLNSALCTFDTRKVQKCDDYDSN